MKNKKFITAVLVLSMMLMGAGYAAWTQDFTVTANVNTGELDIALISDGEVAISTMINDVKTEDTTYASGTVEILSSTYTANVVLDDMYPGAIAEFDVEVENTGTVGIQLDNIGDAVEVDDALLGTYTISAEIATPNYDIAVGETETVHYTVEFVDGDNDTSENLVEGQVELSIPVTYKQYNQ